jgi:protein SCO1
VRSRALIVLLLLAAVAACRRGPEPASRQYELRGVVLAVAADRQEITIKHEDIKGFMPGMTMPFKVRNERLLDGRRPGDLIRATLVVTDDDAYLSAVEKTGSTSTAAPARSPAAAPGVQPGDPLPDARLVDQDGRARTLASFRGAPLAVTFIYTRCPLPQFCPRMDRHFATVQRAIAADPGLQGRVHLASISFDPRYDTPVVLKRHAAALHADPATWVFLTGDQASIDALARGVGLEVIREGPRGEDISHTLRTIVVGADGRIVKAYGGNEWKPDELLADLKGQVASAR